jgi:hypothetical protein
MVINMGEKNTSNYSVSLRDLGLNSVATGTDETASYAIEDVWTEHTIGHVAGDGNFTVTNLRPHASVLYSLRPSLATYSP